MLFNKGIDAKLLFGAVFVAECFDYVFCDEFASIIEEFEDDIAYCIDYFEGTYLPEEQFDFAHFQLALQLIDVLFFATGSLQTIFGALMGDDCLVSNELHEIYEACVLACQIERNAEYN